MDPHHWCVLTPSRTLWSFLSQCWSLYSQRCPFCSGTQKWVVIPRSLWIQLLPFLWCLLSPSPSYLSLLLQMLEILTLTRDSLTTLPSSGQARTAIDSLDTGQGFLAEGWVEAEIQHSARDSWRGAREVSGLGLPQGRCAFQICTKPLSGLAAILGWGLEEPLVSLGLLWPFTLRKLTKPLRVFNGRVHFKRYIL